MKFKGTKGKWFIDYEEQYINENNVLCTPISTNKIIFLCEIYGDDDDAKYNALLISKAPEMLEALKTVISLRDLIDYDESIVNESNIGEASALNQMLKRIDSLIKEATEL